MNVQVKLFAVARQLAGTDTVELSLPEATVGEVRRALLLKIPELHELANHLRFAVNSEYAGDDTVITESCEIACIPPVSGG